MGPASLRPIAAPAKLAWAPLAFGGALVGRCAYMSPLALTRLAVAAGGLALSLTAGAGVASAAPDLGPAINTTCSYSQVVSALNAQDPAAAAQLNGSPSAQAA